MRKIILATIVTALLLCVASCALADTAKVVEVKTGVTKINSADWAEKFPDVYASYMATEENKDVIDHVAEYPMIPSTPTTAAPAATSTAWKTCRPPAGPISWPTAGPAKPRTTPIW